MHGISLPIIFSLLYLFLEFLYVFFAVLHPLTQIMDLHLDLLVGSSDGGQGSLLHVLILRGRGWEDRTVARVGT